MKTMILSAAAAAFLLASPVWAAQKTVTLAVSNMTCVTCPITVKMALTQVKGVSEAAVDFEKKEAVVTLGRRRRDAACGAAPLAPGADRSGGRS